jgi:hypothetical protein
MTQKFKRGHYRICDCGDSHSRADAVALDQTRDHAQAVLVFKPVHFSSPLSVCVPAKPSEGNYIFDT